MAISVAQPINCRPKPSISAVRYPLLTVTPSEVIVEFVPYAIRIFTFVYLVRTVGALVISPNSPPTALPA